mgnify:CR=1 FL=1
MPIYQFQCQSCGLSFDKRWAYAQAKQQDFTTECASCGEKVKREMTPANFQFQGKADSALPQNTGVQSFDTNYDRVIGSDAEQKWKIIQKRQEEKAALLRDNPDKSGKHIRRNIHNHYEVVSDKEKNAFEFGSAVGRNAKDNGRKIQ